MLRNGFIVAALLLVPAFAYGQAHGPFELTIAGSGANGPNFNGFTASADGSIGYFIADSLELSVRQSASYSDLAGVGWDASTRAAVDLHFPLGDQNQLLPFVGANVGYVYGKNVRDTWEAAPEAGVKYFVSQTTFLYGMVEYQFFFNQNSTASSSLRNGQFIYTVGLGWRF